MPSDTQPIELSENKTETAKETEDTAEEVEEASSSPTPDVPDEATAGLTLPSDDDGGHGGGHQLPPMPHLKMTAQRPGLSWCLACGGQLATMLIFVVVTASIGSDFFSLKTEVPLYLPFNTYQKRDDAIQAGALKANFALAGPAVQLERSSSPFVLELIYVAKSGSVFEDANLEKIYAFEQELMGRPSFNDYCFATWTPEAVRNAEEAFLTGDYAEVNTWNAKVADMPCRPTSFMWACNPGVNMTCDNPDSSPPGLLECTDTVEGCPAGYADFEPFDSNFVAAKLDAYAGVNPFADPSTAATGAFMFYASNAPAEFGLGNTVVKAARSQFPLGLPLRGFDNADLSAEEQRDKAETWLYDELQPFLAGQPIDGLDVWYDGPGMSGRFISAVLPADGAYAVLSFLFVWFYLAFMTQSWWLATLGMGQVLFSFFSAYFLYWGVFGQRYFGTFNLLSIFIILGIGADDIFVFLDTFEQALADPHAKLNLWTQLSYTWRSAGKAMMVTSLTTMFSFLTNANSSFPAISTFGIFAAMLVFVNYCSIIIYFPTVVALYRSKFVNTPFCCGLGPAAYKLLTKCLSPFSEAAHKMRAEHAKHGVENKSGGSVRVRVQEKKKESTMSSPGSPGLLTVSVQSSSNAEDADARKDGTPAHDDEKKLNSINQWFADVYYPFVVHRSPVILLAGAVLVGIALGYASQLKPDPDPPAFLPDDNNFQNFYPTLAQYFARGGSTYSLGVSMVWGIRKSNPLDKSDSETTDTLDYGVVQFAKPGDFNLALAMPCMVQMCALTDTANDDLKLGGVGSGYTTECFARDFAAYADAQLGTDGFDSLTGVDANQTAFIGMIGDFINEPGNYDIYKPNIYAEDTGNDNLEFRFLINKIKLTTDVSIVPDDGIALGNTWEAWWDEQLLTGECALVHEMVSEHSYVTGFGSFYVQTIMSKEAFQGIALSLFVALVVLILATGNILIGILSTVCIACIVLCIIGFTVLNGWKLGIMESICFVMVPGLSVDYVAHLAEGYMHSHKPDRQGRTRDMLVNVGVSIVSGSVSTLGASVFLFFPTITFFNKFGIFIFMTIIFALVFSLLIFAAMLAVWGPEGESYNLVPLFQKCGLCKKKK